MFITFFSANVKVTKIYKKESKMCWLMEGFFYIFFFPLSQHKGTLGMKSEKLIRLLLEMLELDSSDYVRLMVSIAYIFCWINYM